MGNRSQAMSWFGVPKFSASTLAISAWASGIREPSFALFGENDDSEGVPQPARASRASTAIADFVCAITTNPSTSHFELRRRKRQLFFGLFVGRNFHGELAVEIQTRLVPDDERVLTGRQALDFEFAVGISHCHERMIERQVIGLHPLVKVAGDVDRQRLGLLISERFAVAIVHLDRLVESVVAQRSGV